ncbi:hypothetical protein F5Y14DRAFT_241188 [Nemania sp. NC0429]|nr:hypothetical protein F5Y14DRAFT_241188 [Nemania sp. NC0429]
MIITTMVVMMMMIYLPIIFHVQGICTTTPVSALATFGGHRHSPCFFPPPFLPFPRHLSYLGRKVLSIQVGRFVSTPSHRIHNQAGTHHYSLFPSPLKACDNSVVAGRTRLGFSTLSSLADKSGRNPVRGPRTTTAWRHTLGCKRRGKAKKEEERSR